MPSNILNDKTYIHCDTVGDLIKALSMCDKDTRINYPGGVSVKISLWKASEYSYDVPGVYMEDRPDVKHIVII